MYLSLQRGNPLLLAILILVALAFSLWVYRKTLPPLPPATRQGLAFLRFASVALLLLLLFDPLITIESTQSIEPNVVVLVDRSSSMGIRDEGGGTERTVSRSEEAETMLSGEPAALIDKLERRYHTSTYTFSDRLEPYRSDSPYGDQTNLSLALSEAMSADWERGVDAFVVITDGIVNAGRDPVQLARELGVPLFPVAVGDPTPARDLSIQQVLSNKVVYVNSRVSVEVSLRGKGFEGEKVPVRILEGEEVVAEEEISFTEKRENRTLAFSFPMSKEGVHRYEVEIPVQGGEGVMENNRFLFTMEAVKEKVKIVVLADRPGWDFSFLRRALDRDPNLDVNYFVQQRDGRPGRLDGGGGAFPFATEELAPYDLVILLGTPAPVAREWGGVLDQFVRRRGGALLHMATDPLSGMVPAVLAELLPVRIDRGADRFRGEAFSVKITPQGKRHAILRLHKDEEKNLALWDELPPLAGLNLVGGAKPGTEVLARHSTVQADGGDLPVLALGAAGKGRVFFANGSGFWNWDFRMWGAGKTNETYELLWSNVVRWMVARGGFRNVTVKPENITYNRGEDIVFRGLVMDNSLEPVHEARLEVTVRGGEEEERRFYLDPSAGDPGSYEKALGPLPAGDYTYQAAVTRGEQLIGEDSGEFSVGEFSAEFLETERDDALLAALARASGGSVLGGDELAGWDGDLSLEKRIHTTRSEREVWNHPAFFLLILGFLSAEWLVRKRKGLS